MGFYGLSQNTADLPGSAYLTYTLSAACELPAYALAVPITEYWGIYIVLDKTYSL